jgi:hypothetical protein
MHCVGGLGALVPNLVRGSCSGHRKEEAWCVAVLVGYVNAAQVQSCPSGVTRVANVCFLYLCLLVQQLHLMCAPAAVAMPQSDVAHCSTGQVVCCICERRIACQSQQSEQAGLPRGVLRLQRGKGKKCCRIGQLLPAIYVCGHTCHHNRVAWLMHARSDSFEVGQVK